MKWFPLTVTYSFHELLCEVSYRHRRCSETALLQEKFRETEKAARHFRMLHLADARVTAPLLRGLHAFFLQGQARKTDRAFSECTDYNSERLPGAHTRRETVLLPSRLLFCTAQGTLTICVPQKLRFSLNYYSRLGFLQALMGGSSGISLHPKISGILILNFHGPLQDRIQLFLYK